MRMQVDVPTLEEWRSIWADCDYATFFHSPDWAETWRRFDPSRIAVAPERLTFESGREVILTLCYESKMRGLLNRHVASPEGTFGGWIAREALTLEEAGAALDHLLDRGSGSLVWRMNPYDAMAFEAGIRRGLACRADETHALDLSLGPERLLSNFKNGYRGDIERALKRGHVHVEPAATLAEWRAYYRVYCETLRRWGHSEDEGYPWSLFQTLYELRSPHVVLWLARHDGVVVSGELCVYAKRHVASWHAATLKDYLRTHVAKVQIFRVIEHACAAGYRWFDFNPSAGLRGVRVFKESFDARPLPAPLVYVDSPFKRFARRAAAKLNVPYAALALTPLAAVASRR